MIKEFSSREVIDILVRSMGYTEDQNVNADVTWVFNTPAENNKVIINVTEKL